MEGFVFASCQGITGAGPVVMVQAHLSMKSMPLAKHTMIVIVGVEKRVNVTVNFSNVYAPI